jgi:hypothetical protein
LRELGIGVPELGVRLTIEYHKKYGRASFAGILHVEE